jgi:hypothetical protein
MLIFSVHLASKLVYRSDTRIIESHASANQHDHDSADGHGIFVEWSSVDPPHKEVGLMEMRFRPDFFERAPR